VKIFLQEEYDIVVIIVLQLLQSTQFRLPAQQFNVSL